MTLGYWYIDKSPKMIAAEQRVAQLSRTFSEAPDRYCAHIMERIEDAKTEESAMGDWYTDKHPRRVAIRERLAFLQDLLKRYYQAKTAPIPI